MKNKFNIINILALGAILYCPLSSANCDVRISNSNLFFVTNSPYKIHIQIKKACSKKAYTKKNIENISLSLYKGDTKIDSIYFDSGLWEERSRRFVLNRTNISSTQCFKDISHINLDMTKFTLNSRDGFYLNLRTGNKYGTHCKNI